MKLLAQFPCTNAGILLAETHKMFRFERGMWLESAGFESLRNF